MTMQRTIQVLTAVSVAFVLAGCCTSKPPGAGSSDQAIRAYSNLAQVKAQMAVAAPREPAPLLTGVEISEVQSQPQPQGEIIKPGQYETEPLPAGAWLDVLVYEQGYGQNEHATLNGSEGTLLKKEGVPPSDVKNWYLWYQFKPFDHGGRFLFTAFGVNGGGKHSASIQIRIAKKKTTAAVRK